MYVSKEKIALAKNADMVDLVQKLGFKIKRHSKEEYRLEIHDSLKLSRQKGWYWNARQIGGNAIDFLMQYPDYNYDFICAVTKILDIMGSDITIENSNFSKAADKPAAFYLPIPYINNDHVIEYLCEKRKLDRNLVIRCIENNYIYATMANDTSFQNVVFVGYDEHGVARYAFQRGTTDRRWAGEVDGSDKRFAFQIEGKISTVLHIFEAAIDLLSYLTIYPAITGTCIALGGTSLLALEHYLSSHRQQVCTIYVHTDNDEAGHRCYDRIQNDYGEHIPVIPAMPLKKDWNDVLLKK